MPMNCHKTRCIMYGDKSKLIDYKDCGICDVKVTVMLICFYNIWTGFIIKFACRNSQCKYPADALTFVWFDLINSIISG